MAMETHTEGVAAGVAKAAHAVKRPYFLVFVFLAVITIIEVQIPTVGESIGLMKPEQVAFLMATAVAKASLVALYYMHLKYEPFVLKYLPLIPLGLVGILIITLVA